MTGEKKPDYDAGNNSKALRAPVDGVTTFTANLARHERLMHVVRDPVAQSAAQPGSAFALNVIPAFR